MTTCRPRAQAHSFHDGPDPKEVASAASGVLATNISAGAYQQALAQLPSSAAVLPRSDAPAS